MGGGRGVDLTESAADDMVCHAVGLSERIPAVWEALHAGLIDPRRAQVLHSETVNVDADTARAVVDEVVGAAPGLTTGQLRARLQRLCLEADPEAAKARFDEAVKEKRVVRWANFDGTADLCGALLPPDQVGRAYDRVNRLARGLKEAGDGRSLDQLRADVYLDLLTGDITSRGQGVVDLTVDLTTLAELNDHPGELAGYGPVAADIARKVAAESTEAEWRYTVNVNGEPIHVGTTSRRPTVSMRRVVQARRRACVFPGCRMPSIGCDLDHRVAVADGGATQPCNLTPLCRRHHRAKHEGGWDYTVTDDHIEWVSPLGHTYQTGGRSPP